MPTASAARSPGLRRKGARRERVVAQVPGIDILTERGKHRRDPACEPIPLPQTDGRRIICKDLPNDASRSARKLWKSTIAGPHQMRNALPSA